MSNPITGLYTYRGFAVDQYGFQTGLVGGFDTTAIVSGTVAPTVNTNYYLAFEPAKAFTLWARSVVATTTYQLFDDKGNPLSSALTNIVASALYSVVPGNRYILSVSSSAAVAINTVVVFLSGKVTPTVFDYFPTGFTPRLPLPSQVSVSQDANGTLTYTATNWPITNGEIVTLGITGLCIASGTLTITSSNPAQIGNLSQPTVVNGSYQLDIVSSFTGNFTGTIIVSMSGVGVEIDVNCSTFPRVYPLGVSSSTFQLKLASAKPKQVFLNRENMLAISNEPFSTASEVLSLKAKISNDFVNSLANKRQRVH